MFEGRIKPKGYGEAGEKPVLRELRWTDLVARLEASRDFQKVDFKPCEAGFASFASLRSFEDGSFDDSSFVDRETVTEIEVDVNHDALSDGKSAAVSAASTANSADRG